MQMKLQNSWIRLQDCNIRNTDNDSQHLFFYIELKKDNSKQER